MDGAQVGVLEKPCKVALSRLLEGDEGLGLELEAAVDAVADGSDEPLEGSLGQHEGSGFLIFLDLSDGNSAGSESALALDTALSGSSLLLGLARLASLRSSGNASLACDLFLSCNLCSWHFFLVI